MMTPTNDTPSALSNPPLMEARRQAERDMDDSSVRTLQDKSIVTRTCSWKIWIILSH